MNDGSFETAIQEIVQRVSGVGPRSIIDNFDSKFDVPVRQSWAVHCLGLQGAYESPGASASAEQKSNFVGSHWCRIVHHDVRHEYNLAIDSVDESSGYAAELLDSLHAGKVAEDLVPFTAYVVARWHDGVGKISFRSEDYVDAFEYCSTALDVIDRFGLERCRADVLSNKLRAEYDRDTKFALKGRRPVEEILRDYKNAIEVEEAQIERDGPHRVERQRGLAGLLQNQAALLNFQAGREEEAAAAAAKSEAISLEIEDHYRIAQARFTRARSLLMKYHRGKNPQDLSDAMNLFQSICDNRLAGARTRILSLQNMGEAQALVGQVAQGNLKLRKVLETLSATNVRSGELGFDLPVQGWTVNRISTLCKSEYADEKKGELRQLEFDVARAGRKIVKVVKYKSDYSKVVLPLLSRLALESSDVDEQLALVEEATARELLDVLSQSD